MEAITHTMEFQSLCRRIFAAEEWIPIQLPEYLKQKPTNWDGMNFEQEQLFCHVEGKSENSRSFVTKKPDTFVVRGAYR